MEKKSVKTSKPTDVPKDKKVIAAAKTTKNGGAEEIEKFSLRKRRNSDRLTYQRRKKWGTRKINRKRKNHYPGSKRPNVHRARGLFSKHKRHLRSNLTPGTILILLTGANKGKRVVLLKNLDSGFLLVTGPYLLNGVRLRKVQQCHVIGTKTKLDVSKINLPQKLNDKFFKRVVQKRKVRKGDKTVFITKQKSYQPNTERKGFQKVVDKQILDVIKNHSCKKPLLAYLSAMFGLKNNQYPHRMQF